VKDENHNCFDLLCLLLKQGGELLNIVPKQLKRNVRLAMIFPFLLQPAYSADREGRNYSEIENLPIDQGRSA